MKFEHWKLRGSLTDKKLAQPIALPEACSFNGESLSAGLEGNTFCPPFTTSLKLLLRLPTRLGFTLSEAAPVNGAIETGSTNGDLLFKATAKDNLEVTSVSLFGLKIEMSCKTAEPIVFKLESEVPSSSIAQSGFPFAGQTTLPAFECKGGLLGSLAGYVLSELLSGPGNPYSLAIEP